MGATTLIVGIGIDIILGVGILVAVVVVSVTIALEFAMSVLYSASVIVDERLDALTTVYSDDIAFVKVSGIGIDMLADVDVNVLAAVMIVLKFIMPV